jgi:hypothetical protein
MSLRLLPVPAIDPPYDDELPTRPPEVEGSLALAFPAATQSLVPLRLVPPAVPQQPATTLPDPGAWTARVGQAIVEVLTGDRSASQLSPYATLDVLEQLERAAGRLLHSRTQWQRRCGQRQPPRRPTLSSVQVCRVSAGVAEVAAVIDTGVRFRALALRLEERDGRWRATVLQVG